MQTDRTDQTLLTSMPPVVDPRTKWLILGSMPGGRSLAMQQYYAHPRNQFWPIMGKLCGFDPECDYQERIKLLRSHGIGLWDSIYQCVRKGSLDSAIRPESITPNDFVKLAANLPKLQLVSFNGAASHKTFTRFVGKIPVTPEPAYLRLPSTSPANASLSFTQKLEAWQQAWAMIKAATK
ncbi:MAG: DNA-deoxyinosine glycosylase [Pseudomonadota bacterium]